MVVTHANWSDLLQIITAEMEPELCRHRVNVARWLYHQGPVLFSVFNLNSRVRVQSVFLSDIASAYRKNPELESLLFDEFFNKGQKFCNHRLTHTYTQFYQLSTRLSPAGDVSSLKPSSGAFPLPPSVLLSHSSTVIEVKSSRQTLSKLKYVFHMYQVVTLLMAFSVITLALIRSKFFRARRTTGSRRAKTFVCTLFGFPIVSPLTQIARC